MIDRFYRDFEEENYAPSDLIKELRLQYLPFITPLADRFKGGLAFDAGCGRGEWLEILRSLGLIPFGVDLDAAMVSGCEGKGLNVQIGDAFKELKKIETGSQVIVSSFHVVEHIDFETLRNFIDEALRVLVPGGLLIIETPNPENIFVATENFYIDPTHIRPIPSRLLTFLVKYAGFGSVKVLRLNEPKKINIDVSVNIKDVFYGVSMDYAVVAQKKGSEEVEQILKEPFKLEYGISLENIINLLERDTNSRNEEAKTLREEAKTLREDLKSLDERFKFNDEVVRELECALGEILSDKSWSLAGLYRVIMSHINNSAYTAKQCSKLYIKKIAIFLSDFINKIPLFKRFLTKLAERVGIRNKIRELKLRLVRESTPETPSRDEVEVLSFRAAEIYMQLAREVERKKVKDANIN